MAKPDPWDLRVMMRVFCLLSVVLFACGRCGGVSAQDSPVPAAATLPGTKPLELHEPLHAVMVRGISRFAERELMEAKERRTAAWLEAADSDERTRARGEARQAVREIIGMPGDQASMPRIEFAQESSPVLRASTAGFAATEKLVIRSCSWNAFPGVTGTGLLAIPVEPYLADPAATIPVVIVIPDADQTPEQLFGIRPGVPQSQQFARRLAESGCVVLCPLLIDRDHTWSGHPDIKWTNMPHREYIYRLSFQHGLHPVGYEVAKVLAGIEALQQQYRRSNLHTVVLGIGEGGLIATAAAAVDEERIDAVAVRGYFSERERVWEEPIYRNLYGQLTRFGDAELAALIAPRPLVIDPGPAPEVDGPAMPEGRSHIAAPGRITTPDAESVKREFEKTQAYYRRQDAPDAVVLLSAASDAAPPPLPEKILSLLSEAIPDAKLALEPTTAFRDHHPGDAEFYDRRMESQVEQLVHYSQRALHSGDKVRAKRWKDLDMSSPEAFEKSAEKYRRWVHESFIGKLPEPTAPLNPRSRKVIDEPTHVGYEVVLDVYPRSVAADSPEKHGDDPGIIAGGILLVPTDLKPGERRPVVVCQHGLEGTPTDTITTDPEERAFRPYQGFSTELVRRGFIVYAPQNPYKGFDDFRVIQRKSNPLGRSLFSYIIEQHRRTLGWLAALPYVDPERIAFYGLSYGGKTAVRVPPLLQTVRGSSVSDDGGSVGTAVNYGYCLSICSADFNDWIRKNVSYEDRYSYVYTPEYEIFEWNMGHIANYAELSWLMVPRPFMVERGHDDGVAPDEWVAWEFAKVRRIYTKLGILDRSEIEWFDGPHAINGEGTYRFLHRHLQWPEPK